MGDRHVYDILGLYLPEHLKNSINTVRFATRQTSYEIIVEALEKYFNDLGLNCSQNSDESYPVPDGTELLEKDGLQFQYRKIRL